MTSVALQFRLRIRDAANATDALVVTSTRGGTNPWLSSIPSGDGQEFDPLTGQSRAGSYNGLIADGITSGTSRVVTSQLEDAGFRQQLIDRRAFVEWSTNGSTWSGGTNGGVLVAGYLTALRLASGTEYSYEVSDATRAERNYVAFTPQLVLDAGVKRKETVAEFLTRWPNRGCILGGPVRGGFLDQPDRGGWEMTVDSRQGPSAPHSDTYLKFNAGYVAPNFERITKPDTAAGGANDKTGPLHQPTAYGHKDTVTTFDDASIAPWIDVVIELVGNGFYQPAYGEWYFSPWTDVTVSNSWLNLLVKYTTKPGIFIRTGTLGSGGVPSAGTKVRVRAFTANPSEISPIYWSGHPVDLLSRLWTEAGVAFSATAIETVRNALGADLRISLRITEPQPLREFLDATIYGPFGIGVRSNDNGELEAFPARIPYAAAPTIEITSADVWTDEGGSSPEIFAIEQSTAISKFVFEHQRLVRTQDAQDENYPDGYVVQSERFERTNADVGAVGTNDVTYSVAGMIHSKDSNQPNLAPFVDARAYEVFDRWGRGVITGEIQGLRGGSTDALKLGDEGLNKHPLLPNHNKRLVDDPSVSGRAMQVVSQTWGTRGFALKLVDSGPNAQPLATAPTLTIAASSDHPRTVAEVTVTNAATLNAANAGLRLQMAVTTGAAPATTDYTDVGAYTAGTIPTGAIALPAVTAGRSVFARAVATKVGSRPSTFSSVANVTLSVLPPVSGLSVSPSGADGSLATVSWTPGDATSAIDVYLRLTADPASADVRQRPLPPGSTRYILEGLTPSGAYTVTVQARDPISGDVSVAVTTTFTAGATTRTLSAPIAATGFTGSIDPFTGVPQRDGVFGIAVVATEYPGFLEVAVAIETGVGSGGFGSFVTDGRLIPTVLGDWTIWSDVTQNDGRLRQIKARHVAPGQTSSSYSSVVTVAPWTLSPLGRVAASGQGTVSIDSNGTWTATADGPLPAQSWLYLTSTSAFASDASVLSGGSNVSGRSFSIAGGVPLSFGQTIYITAIPMSGTGGTGVPVGPSIHPRGAYQTYTATKTTSYSRVAWKDITALGATTNVNNDVINVALGSGTIRDRFGISVLLPVGVTLISSAFDVEWNAAATQALGLFALAVLQNGTSVINSGAPTYAAGVQTVTVSLGSTVTTTGAILFQSTWGNALGPSTADAGQAFLRDVSITYSQPKPDVNV